MADTVFRSSTPAPEPHESEFKENQVGASENVADLEPVENSQADQTVLSALGLDDSPHNLPEDAQSNLTEVREYLHGMMKNKGITPTVGAYKRFLGEVREQMEIDRDADPDVVLNRIGNVVKSYKSLSFISDPKERRSIFMRLARQSDAKSMDDLVYEEMNRRSVWR